MQWIAPYLLTFTLSWLVQDTLSCSCYSFHVDLKPWKNSRQQCLDNGGDLVSMETEEEWSYINDRIQKRTDIIEWHIGLTNLTGSWRWINNRSLTIDKWQEGEPEKVTYKRYVTMAKNWPIGYHGLFNSLRGDIMRARICEYNTGCKHRHLECQEFMNTYQSTIAAPATTSASEVKVVLSTTAHQNNNVVFWDSTTAAPTNQTTSSSIKKSKPYYVVVVAIVLGAIILGACCIVCIACSWKRKRSARRKHQECMSPKNYNGKVSKIENNVNGSQKVKILVESTDEQENADDGSNKCESSDYTDNKDESDMIDSDVQFSCDATSKEEEQHNQVYNNSKHFNHGTPKHQHGIETFPNGYVNGLNIKDIGVDLIKSDVVAPTKEAQYASIVAVPTNPKYSGKVCNQTVLTTFAPVYEENVRNFAHKEYPVYATIDSFRSAAHIPLVQTTSRPHDLNYAELAAFDCNAWHNTKRPPPYEETKYAAVKVPPENH